MASIPRLSADLRDAWRSVVARKGSAVATAGVCALGVGLVTPMFALADPFVLRPLPYPNAGQLVTISFTTPSSGRGRGGLTAETPVPTLDEVRAQGSVFQGVATYRTGASGRLQRDDGAVLFSTIEVTEDLLDLLGVAGPQPAAWHAGPAGSEIPILLTPDGRGLLPTELQRPGAALMAGDQAFRVAGTLPEGTFLWPGIRGHALVPVASGPIVAVSVSADGSSRTTTRRSVIARLQPGVTPADAQRTLAARLADPAVGVEIERLSDQLTRDVRPLALGALAAGMLVLLVCAGNVANLVTAWSLYRNREFATRAALGASRFDLVRLWVVELALTGVAAVAAGLAIAAVALTLAVRLAPAQYIGLGAPAMTWRVVGFAGLAALAVVLAALVPAAFAMGFDPGVLTGRRRERRDRIRFARLGFAAVQSGLAVILVVGAAMLLHSYLNLVRQDTGFDGASLHLRADYPFTGRGGLAAAELDRSIDAIRRIPGVLAASAATRVVADGMSNRAVTIDGQRAFPSTTDVRPGFFEAAGMVIVAGRSLQASDDDWRGVVVNEAFVRQHWPDERPLGRIIAHLNGRQAPVVGVVRDVYDRGLDRLPEPTVYSVASVFSRTVYVARVDGEPTDYEARLRRAIAEVHPDAVLEPAETIAARLAGTVRAQTFATLVLTFFGLAGGAVTVAGLVGIVTFVVARRTREIAIRMAVGAQRRDIRALVAREAIVAAVVGGVAGLLIGRWLSTGLESLVYGVEAGNWTTVLVGAAAAVVVMIVAALVPARRAVRLEPTDALRTD